MYTSLLTTVVKPSSHRALREKQVKAKNGKARAIGAENERADVSIPAMTFYFLRLELTCC